MLKLTKQFTTEHTIQNTAKIPTPTTRKQDEAVLTGIPKLCFRAKIRK